MRQWIERHPLLFAVGIALGTALLPVPLVWVLGILAPGTPEVWQRLVGVIILTAIVLALVARLGWWRESGLTPPAEWRQLPLYILPAVLICWPLLSGIRRTRLQPPTEAVGTVVRALREYHIGADLEDDAVIVCLDWLR